MQLPAREGAYRLWRTRPLRIGRGRASLACAPFLLIGHRRHHSYRTVAQTSPQWHPQPPCRLARSPIDTANRRRRNSRDRRLARTNPRVAFHNLLNACVHQSECFGDSLVHLVLHPAALTQNRVRLTTRVIGFALLAVPSPTPTYQHKCLARTQAHFRMALARLRPTTARSNDRRWDVISRRR